ARLGCRRRRMHAAKELEQQHAQRVDIGRGRELAALQLFRRRVVDGEQGRRRLRELAFRGQQLADAEVEQLHTTRVRDQEVAGLEVAVQNETLMRVLDGV